MVPSKFGVECVYPIDVEHVGEAARLTVLSRLITRHLNALVPQALSPHATLQALDIGCGPGGWVHDVAYEYPKGGVVGIDVSDMMLVLASSGAKVQGLDNASFQFLDATQPLPFADDSFDLVQARFANGFLLQQTWPLALREWVRVTRPGGWVRLIEHDDFGQSSDPAFEQFQHLFRLAWKHDPLQRVLPVTVHLAPWLRKAGCLHIQEQLHHVNFSAPQEPQDDVQAELHLSMCQSLEIVFMLLKPFLLAQLPLPSAEFDHLYEQVTIGMKLSSFRGHFSYLEVLGIKASGEA